MTPTEKQKCIAEQSVYGDLKVLDRDNELWTYAGLGLSELMEGDCALYDDNDNVMYDWIDEVKPILRPMSDLTKEITHKGCNDDQPFIPLVELAKVLGIKKCSLDIENKFLVNWDAEDDNPYDAEHLGFYDGWPYLFKNRGNNYSPAYPCDFTPQIYDLLHLWHLDTRNLIEQDEAIDVNTLDINPYSVK